MKLNGLLGTGSGKLGTSVFTTVRGTQIVRQHQPTVNNPSTNLQVSQRSRFKLASQIAASMADVIAIPRMGLTSSRNLFIKKNMPAIHGNVEGAKVNYEKLQLTNGTAPIHAIVAARASGYLTLNLANKANELVNRVIYCIFTKDTFGQLMLNTSAVVSEAGDDNNFQLKIQDIPGDLAIYAYGLKDANASASATFGNYKVTSASDIAALVSNRAISTKDFIFTKTVGTALFSGEQKNVTPGSNQVMIYVYADANGSVSVKIGEETQAVIVNSGTSFRKAVDKGSKIVLNSMPDIGFEINAWKDYRDNSTVSTEPTITMNSVQDAVDLYATFKKASN